MSIKKCTKCGMRNPLDSFSRHKTTRDGLHTQCKACVSAYNAAYREANRDRLLEAKRKWSRQRDPDTRREERQRNRERYRASLEKWLEENAARKAATDKRWKKANAERVRVSNAKRRALKKAATGEVSADIIWQMAEDQDWLCAYCEVPLFGKYHVDHMIPLSKGGQHDWSNLAISCPTCNTSKKAQTPEEFMLGLRTSN